MAEITVERIPDLHDPVAVIAFSGWNDAATAATDAARFVINRLSGRKFASIDAESFYSFTDSRPHAEIAATGERRIAWQKNEFFYARNPAGPHDVIVSVGVEPNLRWRSFAAAHVELYRKLQPSLVISLGALLAEVPHTRPTRVTGTAADPAVAARLELTTSRYQGPTGIVGVLHDALRKDGVAAASLWANTPHYITTSQNPIATQALLTRLQEMVGVRFDFSELRTAGERFVNEVNTALSANREVASYVARLEEAYDRGQLDETEPELPSATEAISDIEDFLRRNRPS